MRDFIHPDEVCLRKVFKDIPVMGLRSTGTVIWKRERLAGSSGTN